MEPLGISHVGERDAQPLKDPRKDRRLLPQSIEWAHREDSERMPEDEKMSGGRQPIPAIQSGPAADADRGCGIRGPCMRFARHGQARVIHQEQAWDAERLDGRGVNRLHLGYGNGGTNW